MVKWRNLNRKLAPYLIQVTTLIDETGCHMPINNQDAQPNVLIVLKHHSTTYENSKQARIFHVGQRNQIKSCIAEGNRNEIKVRFLMLFQ